MAKHSTIDVLSVLISDIALSVHRTTLIRPLYTSILQHHINIPHSLSVPYHPLITFQALIFEYAMRIAALSEMGMPQRQAPESPESPQPMAEKRNNAELINGLLGMNLGKLHTAG